MRDIKWQDDRDLFGRMNVFTNDPIFKNLRNAIDHYDVNLNDCFSWGQLKSKRWLVNSLDDYQFDLGNVFLCAGWHGLLAYMLFRSSCKVGNITSFDIDDSCADIAETINRNFVKDNWKFKASTIDIRDLEYQNFSFRTRRYDGSLADICRSADTVINTSCEHIEDFDYWYKKIPDGTLVVLQSNNFRDIKEHVNCYDTLEEFSKSAPMLDVYYEGELYLSNYTRFMKIGYK